MKRIAYFAVIAGLFSLPLLGFAQAEKSAADKPAASMKTEAKQEKMAPKPVVRQLTYRSRLDARECLAYPTNREVIICAENFM